MPHAPAHVRLIEMGPRDGLQNERQLLETAIKLQLIHRLAACGLPAVEATAFVAPRWVPQMADHEAVMQGVAAFAPSFPDTAFPVLTPNLKGYESAVAAGAREVAVFAAASESFSQRNINCSVAESIARFAPVAAAAQRDGITLRGYLSCVISCPFEGPLAPGVVAAGVQRLADLGCGEISLGDTTGTGTPASVEAMLQAVMQVLPVTRLAGHFHDTWGMGVANVVAAWRLGVSTFDSSVGGLGGCPYAPGATGNVATEDLVHLFDGFGVTTGVNQEALVDCAWWISAALGREPVSRVARAYRARLSAAAARSPA